MTAASPAASKKPIALVVLVVAILLFPLLGKGGVLAAVILALALVGAPLFVIIGAATVVCFLLWTTVDGLSSFSTLIERTRTLADSPNTPRDPSFHHVRRRHGAGQISTRLIDFAHGAGRMDAGRARDQRRDRVHALRRDQRLEPGDRRRDRRDGGSDLIAGRYRERFSHGLVTSAGSLGILIPPSIPMISTDRQPDARRRDRAALRVGPRAWSRDGTPPRRVLDVPRLRRRTPRLRF